MPFQRLTEVTLDALVVSFFFAQVREVEELRRVELVRHFLAHVGIQDKLDRVDENRRASWSRWPRLKTETADFEFRWTSQMTDRVATCREAKNNLRSPRTRKIPIAVQVKSPGFVCAIQTLRTYSYYLESASQRLESSHQRHQSLVVATLSRSALGGSSVLTARRLISL